MRVIPFVQLATPGLTPLIRTQLIANRSYFVRSDGSDSNNGLSNNAGGAFLTWQHAYDVVVNTLDFNGFTVTITYGQTGSVNTFVGGVLATALHIGGGNLVFQGDLTTPTNCVIDGGANDAFRADDAQFTMGGFSVKSTGGNGVFALGLGKIDVTGNMNYAACAAGNHIFAALGGLVHVVANYTVTGAAGAHVSASSNGVVRDDATAVTITGAPAITIFAEADNGGRLMLAGAGGTGITWTGAIAAGIKFVVDTNASIFTNNAGRSALPGAAAGIEQGGGKYDSSGPFGFIAHKGGVNQTGIASATATKVTATSIVSNPGGFYASSRWTPPPGLVTIHGQVLISGANAAGTCYAMIFKNGVVLRERYGPADAGGVANLDVTAIDVCVSGDFYELFVYITTAGTGTVAGTAPDTFFSGAWTVD